MEISPKRFWNLCQADLWVEYRDMSLVEHFENADVETYQSYFWYPNQYLKSLDRVGEPNELYNALLDGRVRATGLRTGAEAIRTEIPTDEWEDMYFDLPNVLDRHPERRGVQPWKSVSIRSADVLRHWRSVSETKNRSKFDWEEIRSIYEKAKKRNPEFSQNDLIEDTQLAYKDRHGKEPARSTLQRHIKKWS